MLTADQLDALVDPIIDLFEEYQQSVINDIARRLAGMDWARPTAAWQMQRLIESGKVYENALEELAKLTGKSQAALRVMFERAGVKAIKFDDAIYKAAGLNPLPLNLSPAMAQVLAAGLQKTNGLIGNLTLTTAIDGQNAFIQAADLAYTQVTTGAMSYTQAIREAVKGVAVQGLTVVNYTRKRKDQLDVALRRAVLTGVNQTAGQLQMTRMNEMGVDLVQTSAHVGARNKGTGPANHESWQGKIFSRSGIPGKYPGFVETTGYGSGVGLCGYNCRHSFYPFFEGISENAYSQAELNSYAKKTVTYNGETLSFYEATQQQRAIERKIRYWKRQEGGLKASGLDATSETAKVRAYQGEMRDFIKQMNAQLENEGVSWRWQREYGRESSGYVTKIYKATSTSRKIDFRSGEYQYVADLGKIQKYYQNTDPGFEDIVSRPVIYNQSGSMHLTDPAHKYRLEWLEKNQIGLIKTIESPDFIEKAIRQRRDGYKSITLVSELFPGGKTEDRFMVVAVSMSKTPNGFHQITTIHEANWKDIFYADGSLKTKYLKVK